MLFTDWFSICSWCLLVDINVYFIMRFFVKSFMKLKKAVILKFFVLTE